MIDSAIYPIGSKLTFRVGDSDNSIRRSYVTRDPSAASNDYLSESASDAIRPATGPTEAPSVWYPYEDSWAYAHEFGHIMGLHDSYEDKVGPDGTTGSVTREGAVSDAMATKAPIDATTITRLIKRSGLDPKELRCSMSWDIPLSDITIPFTMIAFSLHAWACDYDAPSSAPGSKPVIVFEGDFFGYGVHDDPIAGGGTADSLTRFTTTYHVDDPRLVVQLGLPLHQKVRFRDGILVARENAFIRSTIDLYIDAVSEFKFDAPECPP